MRLERVNLKGADVMPSQVYVATLADCICNTFDDKEDMKRFYIEILNQNLPDDYLMYLYLRMLNIGIADFQMLIILLENNYSAVQLYRKMAYFKFTAQKVMYDFESSDSVCLCKEDNGYKSDIIGFFDQEMQILLTMIRKLATCIAIQEEIQMTVFNI